MIVHCEVNSVKSVQLDEFDEFVVDCVENKMKVKVSVEFTVRVVVAVTFTVSAVTVASQLVAVMVRLVELVIPSKVVTVLVRTLVLFTRIVLVSRVSLTFNPTGNLPELPSLGGELTPESRAVDSIKYAVSTVAASATSTNNIRKTTNGVFLL